MAITLLYNNLFIWNYGTFQPTEKVIVSEEIFSKNFFAHNKPHDTVYLNRIAFTGLILDTK